MRRILLLASAIAILSPGFGPHAFSLQAHHSVDAVFDRTKEARFQATVTKVEWLNPHAHFWADVKSGDGTVENWEFELGSPNRLMQHGWERYTLKRGDRVTVDALPARNGSSHAAVQAVVLPDGNRMANYDLFDR